MEIKLRIGNVLSLFDGMSCGQIALKNMGLEIDNYPEDVLMNVSYTQALRMIGNGWTVRVIEHIFKGFNLK